LKKNCNSKFWGKSVILTDYSEIDSQTLRCFTGSHPQAIRDWLPSASGKFQANPNHRLTARERKHRFMLRLERWLGWQYQKKHYKLVS
jgi:hypothetical protein